MDKVREVLRQERRVKHAEPGIAIDWYWIGKTIVPLIH
jgi:hypothetical protein